MSRILYTPEIKRKKNTPLKKYFFSVALFFLIIAVFSGVIYLSRLPYFQISKIEINGGYTNEKKDIEDKVNGLLTGFYFSFIPKKNYFLFRSSKAKEVILKEFPRVEEVSVTKSLNSIFINIKEHEPWAIYCSSNCAFIDKNGFIYEEAPASFGNIVKLIKTDFGDFSLGSRVLPEETIKTLVNLEEKVDSRGLGPVSEYIFTAKLTDEIKVKTGDKFYLILNLKDDLTKVFAVLDTVLGDEIGSKRGNLEYIDLRFGNKVFYKYKN